jgi:hypothetical protein
VSGAGTGKGLLARSINRIAYGREPHAVTGGFNTDELDKRIASELMDGSPCLFLDNLNNINLKSDLLASAITERPAKVRVLGKSQMVMLNPTALVVLTGNGLTVSEDLARRFIEVNLDARMEDPESRAFKTDIQAQVLASRASLLAAVLTVWRWGRVEAQEPGMPLGGFEQWSSWVRDPLMALGCHDPVARVQETKQRDTRRQEIGEAFGQWDQVHGHRPVTADALDVSIKRILDPQDRGRQYLAAKLARLVGTRVAGRVLTRQAGVGRWSAATYALETTTPPEPHSEDRERMNSRAEWPGPDDPYDPYADGKEAWRARL